MTEKRLCDLPTGDNGQRFQITARDWPNKGFNIVGWSNSETNASEMAKAIAKAPGCKSTQVYDRETDWPIATYYDAKEIRS